MILREPLPKDILELLHAGGVRADQVEISLPSDIDEKGHFGQEWLVVAGGQVWVLAAMGTAPCRCAASP